jgi:hypothetical protein
LNDQHTVVIIYDQTTQPIAFRIYQTKTIPLSQDVSAANPRLSATGIQRTLDQLQPWTAKSIALCILDLELKNPKPRNRRR